MEDKIYYHYRCLQAGTIPVLLMSELLSLVQCAWNNVTLIQYVTSILMTILTHLGMYEAGTFNPWLIPHSFIHGQACLLCGCLPCSPQNFFFFFLTIKNRIIWLHGQGMWNISNPYEIILLGAPHRIAKTVSIAVEMVLGKVSQKLWVTQWLLQNLQTVQERGSQSKEHSAHEVASPLFCAGLALKEFGFGKCVSPRN